MSETNQIKQVNVIRNAPLSQDFTPLGYDKEHVLNKVARANFYNFGVSLNPETLPGKINAQDFVRSETYMYGINGNNFIWDSVPELQNQPVTGLPNEVSQQYVLYNVQPNFIDKSLSKLNIHQQAVPTAYNTTIPTNKQQQVVMQVPVTSVLKNIQQKSVFQRIKEFFVGA